MHVDPGLRNELVRLLLALHRMTTKTRTEAPDGTGLSGSSGPIVVLGLLCWEWPVPCSGLC